MCHGVGASGEGSWHCAPRLLAYDAARELHWRDKEPFVMAPPQRFSSRRQVVNKHACAIVLTLAACIVACSAESRGTGVSRLEDAPLLTLREESRIGSSTDPNIGFTLITGAAVDRDGNVYAFDSRESEFRVFGRDGQLLRKFGRRGEGPGEFDSAPSFGVTGDTLWTLERDGVAGRKLTLFRLNGEILAIRTATGVRVRLQGDRGTGIVFPYELHEGILYGRMTTFTGSRPEDAAAPELTDTVRVPIVRWNLDGNIVDTAAWYNYPPLVPRDGPSSMTVGGRFLMIPRAPAEASILIPILAEVVIVDNSNASDAASASARITRLNSRGDTAFVRSYSYDPYPYDEAALDAIAWRNAKTGGGIPIIDGVPTPPPTPPDSALAYKELRAAMKFPPFQAPFAQGRIGDDGTIWLSRYKSGGTGDWMIFGGDGQLHGRLTMPENAYILRMTSDEIWASVRDEADIPWLVRYAVVPAGGKR
jgi:hypothetical protein